MRKGETISLTVTINLKEGSDLAGVIEAIDRISEHPDVESVSRSKQQTDAPVDSGYFLKGRH